MTRADLIDTVTFNFPRHIPVIFHINQSCWDHYPRHMLAELIAGHPTLFPDGIPDFVMKKSAFPESPNPVPDNGLDHNSPGAISIDEEAPVPYAPWCRREEPWIDPWGCVWETTMSGIIGAVTAHPLPDWERFSDYAPPDYMRTTHWYPVSWEQGTIPGGGSIGFFDCLRSGEIGHGHTLLKLIDILGYERALLEMYDATPEFSRLMELLEEFNAGLVRQFISTAGVEWLGYAEDLGMQQGPLVSPSLFRTWILPVYKRLMSEADRKDILIHMHADGDIKALADDLLTLPVHALNIQDTPHGIDWIAENIKGKKAVDLDIDRVGLIHENSPHKVHDYLSHVVNRLFDPAGGLILTYGLYPGVPAETVVTMMDSLERIARKERNR